MIVLSGADVVLSDRVLSPATIVIEDDVITAIEPGARAAGTVGNALHVALDGLLIVPGFVDVHVHGVSGLDVLDGPGAVRAVAELLPRWGVTAFCPTTIACAPAALSSLLDDIGSIRTGGQLTGARVLPAHLESNFINPEYRGAQPLACLRRPPADARTALASGGRTHDPRDPRTDGPQHRNEVPQGADSYTGDDLLGTIGRHRADVGIVTLAPELEGGIDLVRALTASGIRVSLGHSGATYDQAMAAIEAGARHVTHLFNRMRAMSHREPGLTGAALAHDEVATELICDGVHVHHAALRLAIAAKGPNRVMAISDGTAGSGLPRGARATLGGYPITVGDTALLDDGTIAGSVLTMDRAFAALASSVGASLVDAAAMCATTPARELGLQGLGVIAPGSKADLAVLDASFRVRQTWLGGVMVFSEQ
jgi:N-acetylglucosamine-6-phosphate deacetylase